LLLLLLYYHSVHLEDRHTPIYGDEVYGTKSKKINRPLLHAYKLELDHPVTGEKMVFQAPLADDMLQIAQKIYPEGPQTFPDIFPSPSL
jgi:hypothetical protein